MIARVSRRDTGSSSLWSRRVEGQATRADGTREAVAWLLAEEVPVALVYNAEPYAVMMATPSDLEDFAVGFSVAEAITDAPEALLVVKVEPEGLGVRLCIGLDPDRLGPGLFAGRSLAGRTSCGLCGVTEMQAALRVPNRVIAKGSPPTPEAIARAVQSLPDHQPMNRANRSVHAAAFCDRGGRILLCREDVGRHNALDKAIGALLRQGLDPADGFMAMSSRCSVELVQKAATVGIPLLATVSAPTALAVEWAARAGLRLAARSRSGGVVTFPG